MIKRPNKYIYGIIISTALSSSGAMAIENTVNDSKEVNINNDNNEVAIIDDASLDIESAKQKLQKSIDKANEVYRDAVLGDLEGQYPEEAGLILTIAIKEATAVVDESSSTIEDLDGATKKLDAEISKFIASIISISELKAELLKLIIEVTEFCNKAPIGFEIGQYPIEEKETLLSAISKAESIYNGPSDTGSAFKKAIEDLNASKQLFLDSKIKKVDVSALIAKITELELFGQGIAIGNSPEQYPLEAKTIFDAVLLEAKNIVGNCTYQESLDMIDKLNKAKSDLENALIKYDDIIREGLNEQLKIAENLRDSAKVGDKPGEYTQESLNKLYSAIYSAKITNDNRFSSQSEIDAAVSLLKSSITEFKNSIIEKESVDLSELMGLINQAEQLVFGTEVGNDINQVPDKSEKEKLQAAINSANSIASLNSPTQIEIDKASNDLKQAIIDFRDKINKEIDKESLSDEIKRAVALQTTITDDMIGDEVGKYPFLAKVKLDNAIAAAQKILQSATTQNEINEMVKTLSKAIDECEKSLITEITNKLILKDTIERAEYVIKDAIVGDKDGMFPKESYDKLNDVIKSAKLTLESLQVTQIDIDAKVTELEAAIDTFLKSENVKYKDYRAQLEIKKNEYLDLYNSTKEGESIGEYPTKVKQNFYKAIEKAKSVLTKNSKVSEDYITALDELEKAKAEFEKGVISNEDVELHLAEMQTLLKQMSSKIKEADTSSEENRVPENKKIALSVIYNRISVLSEGTDNLLDIKEAIKLAKYAISDFNDRSIYIDNKNVVHGKKLTGEVGSNNTGRENINIVDKKEFIPKAGMPIDIKGAFASIGATFIGISGFMFRKKK